MQHFHNDLQSLGMDQYQVGEAIPFDPYSQMSMEDPRHFGRCGGFRCGGFGGFGGFRCGGFRCGGCGGCAGCAGCGGCAGCAGCFSCFGCFGFGLGFI